MSDKITIMLTRDYATLIAKMIPNARLLNEEASRAAIEFMEAIAEAPQSERDT